jgi:sucrose phosphorylase
MKQPSGSLSVPELLERVYESDDAAVVTTGIERLVADYGPRLDAVDRPSGLSERDVMLITYGDTLNAPDSAPLRVLHRFYAKRLNDSFRLMHILPFHPFTSDDGFSVVDFFAVREDLGDWDDIRALAADCRLMADAVINHVSSESHWFRSYLDDETGYEEFFLDVDPAADLSDVVRPRTSPLLTAFRDAAGRERHIWTTFSADQVDLNYANPKVLLAVIEVLFFLISQGARLLRLDAVTYLWKQPGTPSANMAETHALIKVMRAAVESLCSNVVVITETNVPHRENVAYFGNGRDEAHMVYNFALPPLLAHSFVKGDSTRLSNWAASLTLPGSDVCFLNFSASHDGVGVRPVEEILEAGELDSLVAAAEAAGGQVSYRSIAGENRPYEINCTFLDLISAPGDPDPKVAARFIASQAIVLAMPGVPAIYIQSLIGSRNDLAAAKATGRARSINRHRHELADVEAAIDDAKTLCSMVFHGIVGLITARQTEPAFAPSAGFKVLFPDRRVFAIRRIADGSAHDIVALTNLTDDELALNLEEDGAAVDIISGETQELSDVNLEAFGVRWLRVVR